MPLLIRSDDGVGVKHHGFGLLILAVTMTAASIGICLIRTLQRRSNGKNLGKDDYIIIASVVFDILLGITTAVSIQYGYGMHQSELGSYDLYVARLAFYLEQIFYKGTLNCTKLSMLLQYLRLFENKRFRAAAQYLAYTILGYAVASILVTIVQCLPFAKIFDHSAAGVCIDLTSFWYSNAIFNLVTDMMILALPIPEIHLLQMQFLHKVGLFLLFALGLFVCGITIIRMTPLEMSSKSPDVTFGSYGPTYWTVIEANTAILCTCLPTWKALLATLLPWLYPISATSSNWYSRAARRVADLAHTIGHGHSHGSTAPVNLTSPFSHGRHGVSRVSQASSQVPIIASPAARRSRKDTLQAMSYDDTVSAGEPSFGRGTQEPDFKIPDGRAGRFHNQDAEMHAPEPVPAPYPAIDEDEDYTLFIEALKRDPMEDSH